MSATGFKLQYKDANNAQQTVALELAAAIEGGSVTGNPKFSFKSHAASELTVRFPAVSPDVAAKIPFESPVSLLFNNSPVFQGRRISRPGTADPHGPYIEYCFQDAWYDLEHITFKQVWFGGAYQPCTVAGMTVTFTNAQLGQSAAATEMLLYTASGGTAALPGTVVNIVSWTDPTHAVISGSPPNGAVFASLLYTYPDVVLFQYRPTDPYQNASQVTQFYITTGAQIQEILNFAIAQGVNLQYNAAELLANCNLDVPWYPLRAGKCAEAILKCLRMHPDCFTEIDYTTTPPTFHVRKRMATASPAGQVGLVQVTLPYEATDGQGRRHLATDITPRPELVPNRIGIFYRYLVNGNVLAFPTDVWPANAPDGLRAFDYSLDLQGPRIQQTVASIISVPLDVTNSTNGMTWWMKKVPTLKAPDISGVVMCDKDGNIGTGSLTVLDDGGNPISGSFAYELVSGTMEFWFSGIASVTATATTYFKWSQSTNGLQSGGALAHASHARVRLVNTPSVVQSFTQYLTTGEAIPTGLAQSVYTALQQLQYNLSHKILEVPFSGAFIKPGLNGINLSGGDPAWTTMNATVQSTEYTLHADSNGNVFAEYSVQCGPVEHLEPGQLVQLFNMFSNRDILKIDPWERLTGIGNPSSSYQSGGDDALENTNSGAPKMTLDSVIGGVPGT